MAMIVDNIQEVSARIARACDAAGRPVSSVTLLAVSKTQRPEAVREALDGGQRRFGENYVQEALDKIAALAEAMDKRVSPHLAEGRVATVCNMHLVASLPNAEYLEIDHDLPLKAYSNGMSIFENPPVFQKGGYFNVPQGPGLGVTINKDLILA